MLYLPPPPSDLMGSIHGGRGGRRGGVQADADTAAFDPCGHACGQEPTRVRSHAITINNAVRSGSDSTLAVIQGRFTSRAPEKRTLAGLPLWTDWWHSENHRHEVVIVTLFTVSVACLNGLHLLHE